AIEGGVKMRRFQRLILCWVCCAGALQAASGCKKAPQSKITIGSKFFTEQVVLAELLAQHIEAKTGIPVVRKTNLGGTLLVHKALLSGDLDLYVEYTGTALTTVLNEKPQGTSEDVYNRVKKLYEEMVLKLMNSALVDNHIDVVAGNYSDWLFDLLCFLSLDDEQYYFPP